MELDIAQTSVNGTLHFTPGGGGPDSITLCGKPVHRVLTYAEIASLITVSTCPACERRELAARKAVAI